MRYTKALAVALYCGFPSVASAQAVYSIIVPDRDLIDEDQRMLGKDIAWRIDAVRYGYRVCIDGQLTAGESKSRGSESTAKSETSASRLARVNHAISDCASGRNEQVRSMEPKLALRVKLQLDAIDQHFRDNEYSEPAVAETKKN